MADKNITIARSMYYEFFAMPLFFSENDKNYRRWKEQISYLKTSLIEPSNLADFENLESFDFEAFRSEQNSVLFDYSYANVPLTASFYNEGMDDGKMRLSVINTMRKSKFRRDTQICKDSEDFIGFVFYLMSSLLRDEAGGNNFLSTELFVNVINDFIDEFIELMSENRYANFFKSLSNLMKSFFSFERAALGIEAPVKEASKAKESIARNPSYVRENEARHKYGADTFEFYED